MSEGLSYDHQTTTMDTDNVVAAAPTHSDQPLTEEAVTANEGDDVPQIPDDEPSLSNAPVVQGEDLPLSSVEHSAPPSSYEDTVVDHPAAADQSALQPPGFIDLLSAPITTAFHHLLDQATYPPFRQSIFQALHHWPSFQSARLLLRTLWKPSVRRIIIP